MTKPKIKEQTQQRKPPAHKILSPPKMNMTTDIHPAITTPDSVEDAARHNSNVIRQQSKVYSLNSRDEVSSNAPCHGWAILP